MENQIDDDMENETEATTYGFGAGRLGFRDWASEFQC